MKSLAFLLSGLALAAGAQAGVVTYGFTNDLADTEISQSGSLKMFDSTKGTLTSVSMTFSGADSAILGLNNHGATSQMAKATSTVDLYFNSSLAPLDSLIQANNPLLSLVVTTGLQNVPANTTLTFGPLTDSESLTWTSQLNGILSSFIGAGNFQVGCTSFSGINTQGGGGQVNTEQTTQAKCGANITYSFDDAPLPNNNVPEPAAPALVGVALLGVWAVRRRKA